MHFLKHVVLKKIFFSSFFGVLFFLKLLFRFFVFSSFVQFFLVCLGFFSFLLSISDTFLKQRIPQLKNLLLKGF